MVVRVPCRVVGAAVFGMVVSLWAPRVEAECAAAPLMSVTVGSGVATPLTSDTVLRSSGTAQSYVARGSSVLAINRDTGVVLWTTVLPNLVDQQEITPVRLSLGAPRTFMVFVADATGVVYGIDATTGGLVWTRNIVSFATAACPPANVTGPHRVAGEPVAQIYDLSNQAFKNAMASVSGTLGKTVRDVVYVNTRLGCTLGRNRIQALSADDGTVIWTFNVAFTFDVNAALDSCALVYASDSSAPPSNNTLFCTTDQSGPTQNSLWALSTATTSTTGTKVWVPAGVPAGPIGVRVQARPDRGFLYYGTLDGAVRVKRMSDGSDAYPPLAVASAVTRRVWSEFRPPFPGLTNMIQLTTADGVYRRVLEDPVGMTLVEATPTTAGAFGTFVTPPVVLPAEGKVYLGTSSGNVVELDAALGPTSPVNSRNSGSSVALPPSLDFSGPANPFSSTYDRIGLSNLSGQLSRFCVPWAKSVAPPPPPAVPVPRAFSALLLIALGAIGVALIRKKSGVSGPLG